MGKTTEKCPGCQSERVGIQEGIVYFKCGSYCGLHDGKSIFRSGMCGAMEPDFGLFNVEEPAK